VFTGLCARTSPFVVQGAISPGVADCQGCRPNTVRKPAVSLIPPAARPAFVPLEIALKGEAEPRIRPELTNPALSWRSCACNHERERSHIGPLRLIPNFGQRPSSISSAQTPGGAMAAMRMYRTVCVKGLGVGTRSARDDQAWSRPPCWRAASGGWQGPERAESLRARDPACLDALDLSGRPVFTPEARSGPPCRCARSREFRKLSRICSKATNLPGSPPPQGSGT